MACCRDCDKGRPCASRSLGADKFHSGGVTQLQYVGNADGLGDYSSLLPAVQYGLLAMGVACLLGVGPRLARLVGIAGVGYGLLRKGS